MKTIGIVTCFNQRNVNYGNRLQAVTLNQYINGLDREVETVTLQFSGFNDNIETKTVSFLRTGFRKIKNKFKTKRPLNSKLNRRLERFNDFSKKYIKLSPELDRSELKNLDFDAMITGSDIVWYQSSGLFKPIRFLDFQTRRPFRKYAYAASFGRDWIPEENIPYVKKALNDFQRITVREKSSIKMLSELGIHQVSHAVDSTLLLSKDQWISMEKIPDECKNLENTDFVFVYLLGEETESRNYIMNIAYHAGLKVVTVPYARGFDNPFDDSFGDIRVMDCSPEEWLWLVHHADYVITDSFHGVVFSTIYHSRFLVIQRKEFNINNRLIDYLDTINQNDKIISIDNSRNLNDFVWDFEVVDRALAPLIDQSRKYLGSIVEGLKA